MATTHVAAGIIFAVSIAATVSASPASAEVVRAVEYYHQAFEHYFVTSSPAEIVALDTGVFQGWWRTGQRYRVDDAPVAGLFPVCRFYTSVYAGKASHFFTASAAECEHVKTMPDWTYEGVAFYARVPDAEGKCDAGTAAIHRLFNNGRGGAPNHAYTADVAKKNTLVGAGWISEGVAYCTPLAVADPFAQTLMLDGSTWDLPSPAIFSTANMVDYGSIQTRFSPITPTTIEYAFNNFAYYGFPHPPAAINAVGQNHWIDDAWFGGGAAAWDPLAGAYVLFIYAYAPKEWWGIMWTFDNAEGPTTPVCTMGILDTVQSHDPYVRNPFQPYVLSGCEPGVANRH